MKSIPDSGQMLVLTHLAVFVGGKLVGGGGHIPLHLVGVSVQWSHQGQESWTPCAK